MRPDLDWGFRVGIGYDRDCSYGEVSYLWYESLDTATVARSEFVLPITIFGLGDNDAFQKGSYRLLFRYQNVDFRWGQHVTDRCGRTLNLFGNVRWVDLQRKSQARGVATAGGVGLWDQHSRFTGAAFGVGASADVSIWRCLSFAGTVNGMAAIGERKVTLNRRSVPVPANDRIEQQPGESSVIPALDLRFGVRYVQLVCGSVKVWAEVGYEMHQYWNVLDYTQQGTDDIGIVPCQDVGFGGPYLSVKASY